uniref:Ig-like domain-containing protein n=1 Tax=Timema monikensis TaxID=170555 RepID=A0A7R9HI93_9NEOP|nr:unnamed protein product [Timema monikensis]
MMDRVMVWHRASSRHTSKPRHFKSRRPLVVTESRLPCDKELRDTLLEAPHDHILDYDESEGIYPTGRSLQLRKLIKESAGEYSCAASNSEGKIRSGPAVIFVQCKYNTSVFTFLWLRGLPNTLEVILTADDDSPRCRPGFESHRLGAWRQRSLSVECEVDANPGGSDVRFSWTYNRSRDVLPVPGDRVNSSGTSSRLVYTPGSEQDFGTLACWASNSVGRQRVPCLFHVVHARKRHRGISKTKRFTRSEDKKGRVRVMLQKVVVIFGIQTADPRGLLLLLCEYLTARILCLAITQS